MASRIKIEIEEIWEGKARIASIAYAGDVTLAVANIGGVQGIGAAKCMLTDKYSKKVGAGIALARAIRNAGDELEQSWTSRSMSLADWKAKHKREG